MASDYETSKSGGTVFPDHALSTEWDRLEPLLTPERLRNEFLFGIPLVSNVTDPTTGKRQVMTDQMLDSVIKRAVSLAEQELQIDIFPVQREERLPFDQAQFQSFMYVQLSHVPCTSIQKWQVIPTDGSIIFTIPLEWIETKGGLSRGRLNVIPLTTAVIGFGSNYVQSTVSPGGGAGAVWLSILGMRSWIPSFWNIKYTSGFTSGLLPRDINEFIGTIAAIEVLGMLGATYSMVTSHSLGYDGMSQSVSTPGPNLFRGRLDELREKRDTLKLRAKGMFHSRFSLNVI